MPTESDLRDLFRGPDGDGGLDAGSIIRRAHRRRAPKVIAASVGAALVVAAVVVPVAGLGLSRGGASEVAGSAASDPAQGPAARSQDLKAPSTTDGATACAAPAAAATDADLTATLGPLEATVGSPVSGTLVLTGSGASEDVRVTGPMAVTLRRDDAVVWSGTVDLGTPRLAVSSDAPARLPFTLAPVDCGSGSMLAAGAYAVEASIPVSIGGADARAIPASGTLRIR